MPLQTAPTSEGLATPIERFVADVLAAIPSLLTAALFLVLAYLAIRIVLAVVRAVLERVYPESQRLVVDLLVAVVGVFLWFGAALALLDILGMGEVAAGLGTATGFVGLGVTFALKDMIADTVAGVYLLRDPDFEEGDLVETASVTGRVVEIDLRKTRLRTDRGELAVLPNSEVERKWTLGPVADADDAGGEAEGTSA